MRQKTLGAGVVVAAGIAFASGVAMADRGRGETVHAKLEGFNEVPAVSSPGAGSFKAKIDRRSGTIEYELEYEGLQGQAFQAHIHIGQRHTNGGISIWLCGNPENAPATPAGTPRCPELGGEVRGIITASAVVGPAAQLIAPGELGEVLRAIREDSAYVNVHTTAASGGVPGGEIRGQIK